MQAVCVGKARETATRSGWMALVPRTDRPAAAALPVGPPSPADLLSARGHQNGGLLSKSARRSHRRSTSHLGNRRGHERSPCGPSWCAVRAPFIVLDDALHEVGQEEAEVEERGSVRKCVNFFSEVHTSNTICIRVHLPPSGGLSEVSPKSLLHPLPPLKTRYAAGTGGARRLRPRPCYACVPCTLITQWLGKSTPSPAAASWLPHGGSRNR